MGEFSPGGGMSVRRDRAEPSLPKAGSERKITTRVAPPRHPWQRAREFATQRMATRGGSMVGASEQSEGVGTLPQQVRRDFSAIGYDEAMRRAREIVPILRERAQRAEDARMLIRDNEQLLHESGLFRFHQPKAFG